MELANSEDDSEKEWITEEDERKLRFYLCACCRLIEHKLPDVAKEAVQLAEDYNQGLVEAQILHKKHWELWSYLDQEYERCPDSQARNVLDSSIRAAIGCAWVDRQDVHGALESLDWGPAFCNRVEAHHAEQQELYKEIFGPEGPFSSCPYMQI